MKEIYLIKQGSAFKVTDDHNEFGGDTGYTLYANGNTSAIYHGLFYDKDLSDQELLNAIKTLRGSV